MNKYIVLALIVSNFSCGATSDDDGPLDEEFGFVVDGKQDSPYVRSDSPEATAILQYVNRPLATQNYVDTFFDDLDTKLHSKVAQNIVDFRLGSDGIVGSADDLDFKKLKELDAIPFIGAGSLKLLFDLANEAGLFPTKTICLESNVSPVVSITTVDQLVEIENSKCTAFEGSLVIDIQTPLPPKHRGLKAFDKVVEIGLLAIVNTPHLVSPEFRGLKSLGGLVSPSRFRRPDYSLDSTFQNLLKNLEKAGDITLDGVGEVLRFPKLKKVEGMLRIASSRDQSPPTLNQTFPVLTEASVIYIDNHNYSFPIKTGIFPSLTKLERLYVGSDLEFTELKKIVELQILEGKQFKADFLALKKVGELNIRDFEGSFPELEVASSITITSPSYPFPKLKVVEGDARIFNSASAVQVPSILESVVSLTLSNPTSFDKLTQVTDLLISCSEGTTWKGINALTKVKSISIGASNCEIGGLDNVVEVSGRLGISVDEQGRFSGLNRLETANELRYSDSSQNPSLFPKLSLVESLFIGTSLSGELVGFNSLEYVEDTLEIRSATTIGGLKKLSSVGKEISFPSGMSDAERDKFLSQLKTFSGKITTN